ncbi:hypothetical protein DMB38_13780 [Streptomyces sp. WAC 06738]|uniref:hypothetical protein n=1 Tax=Streptomyces sp. WAC 06738 TaxID=2203210 RepID=UPI000F6BE009|nr:hypothetical protein [Streptomyces sp. WAC 06738]AZM46738.1 hypothetical protein DMB38_13780 [Streptomyces sp. WAC 06738]
MALIAVAADKGAPGVTTTAVALAAVWPRRALLAEADPAGGDLVYRSVGQNGNSLDPNTGMLSLAATARRGIAAEQLWDHAQPMSGGLDVIVGLGNSDQSAGLTRLWPTLGRAFAALAESPHGGADVIADCGRVGVESGTLELFSHASLVLLVARALPEQIARVRDRASSLSARLHGTQRGAAALGTPLIGVLLVTEPSGAAKVAAQVNDMLTASQSGARVLGVIADDVAGAEQLAGRRRGRAEKSMLVRSIRKVASDLHQHFGSSLLAEPASAGAPQAPYGGGAPQAPYGGAPGQGAPQQPGHAAPQHAQQPQAPGRQGRPAAPGAPAAPAAPGQPGAPGQPAQPGPPAAPGQHPAYGAPGATPGQGPAQGPGPRHGAAR